MENKADIDFTTETKKKKVLLFCWCVVYHFSSTKSVFSRKQTDRKLKNHPRIKICVRRAEKIRSIRTANESFNCNGVPFFAACYFFLKQ